MEVVFNLLVIGFVALIAYWWANQGLLGATMHLLCVLCAGVLAFASWEPASSALQQVDVLQGYSLGVGLLLPFAVYLFILRLLADKFAPDNINFPHAINLAGGGVFGAGAAILTVGISLIGVGHLQSSRDLLGVAGAARDSTNKGQPNLNARSLWLPVHKWSADTFGWLSEGSMSPSFSDTTLASMQPNLGEQSLSLFRDTYEKSGRIARVVAAPGSITVKKSMLVPDYTTGTTPPFRAYLFTLGLAPKASTEGQGFAISASQLRLVGQGQGLNTPVAYPIGWWQPNNVGALSFRLFDDIKNFVYNETAGTTSLDITLVYRADDIGGGAPRFLHAMGQRLPIGTLQELSLAKAAGVVGGATDGGSKVSVPTDLAPIKAEDLIVNDSILPANIDLNNLGGAMEVAPDTNLLLKGEGYFASGGYSVSKSVVVKGIWSPPGTRVVRLNLSRGSRNSVDWWNDRDKKRDQAGPDAQIALIDDIGQSYYPVGFIHVEKSGDRRVTIKLEREGTYYKIVNYPHQSSAGRDDLFAVFTPAIGRTIVGVRLGDVWMSRANLKIPAPN